MNLGILFTKKNCVNSDFHAFVAKSLFARKRARPDIQPTVAFPCTRAQEPTEEDWFKLVRMMKFLKGTEKEVKELLEQLGISEGSED